MSRSEKFRVYVRAYGRHFFRTALWVTLVCVTLFLALLLVPQAGELILSQATWPAAEEDSSGSFVLRLIVLNLAAALLAASVWLSARILVHTEITNQAKAEEAARQGHQCSVQQQPADDPLPERAARQAATYVPRQLGLSIFLILQIAAAGSISVQGYWLPIALVLIWLFVLVMGLLRLDDVDGEALRGWWKGLLALVFCVACVAFYLDWRWLGKRALPLVRAAHDNLGDAAWLQEQHQAVYFMGGFALAICALLFVATRWIAEAARGRRIQAWVSSCAWALILIGFGLGGLLTRHDLYWVFFACQSLLATAYWLTLQHGHNLLDWAERVLHDFTPAQKLKELTRSHVWLLTAGVIAVVTACMAVGAALEPIRMGGHLGAVGMVLLFLAYIVLVVAWLQVRIGQSSWRMTVPAGSVGVIALAAFFAWPTDPQPAPSEEPQRVDARAPTTVQQELDRMAKDGPLFAIAAHGGGIRAAQYTAAFLAWLDHETGYQFSDRLVAASGASGGSVGLAVWAAARAAGCKDQGLVGKAKIPACVNAVSETLAQDHLAPLIASGLFRDYLQFFRPPARGNILQESILRAADQVPMGPGKTLGAELERRLPEAAYGLLLNATVVGTAEPLSFVTRPDMLPRGVQGPAPFTTYVQSTSTAEVSLLTAAMHSARFPLISPKGMVGEDTAVVDGGYFDNSGAAVLRQHILSLRARPGYDFETLKRRLVVVSLDSEPIGSAEPKQSGDSRNSFDEIIGTIVAARGAHGQAAWHQLCTELDAGRLLSARPGAPLWQECEWPSENSNLPGSPPLWKQQREARAPALGWHLSARSARRVTSDAREKAMQIAERFKLDRSLPGPAKGVTMQRMAH